MDDLILQLIGWANNQIYPKQAQNNHLPNIPIQFIGKELFLMTYLGSVLVSTPPPPP